MKKISTILLATIFALLCFTGCENGNLSTPQNESSGVQNGTFTPTGGTLRVYNAAEYIDMTTVADFEREYNIKVELLEFESNETLYAAVSKNPQSFDVLIPSDYTIDRLIKEGMLAKLNMNNIPNIAYVAEQYLNPVYDSNNEYVIPYMVGTVGILYNKRLISETVDSWSILWNPQYKGQIFMWDSMRDILGLSLKRLGYSINSVDENEIILAERALIEQLSLIKAYADEDIRAYMVADEGALAVVYSGEAKKAIEQNPRLAYVIPEEGSNKWVDGFVIMKDSKNKEAAEQFINFMCRPNIAIRNMTVTGYTSPIKDAWSEFCNNSVMFPTDAELNRCEAFLYNRDATSKYEAAWRKVRGK